VAVVRRGTYAAEGRLRRLEGQAAGRDALLESMTSREAALSARLALLDERVGTSRQQSSEARARLAEAVGEMEGVRFEARLLRSQWRAALAQAGRCDSDLQASSLLPRERLQPAASCERLHTSRGWMGGGWGVV
jgi:hypothetical protein